MAVVIVTGWGEKAACTSAHLSGPEITDELVKVLRRRLDEATLDIITVMLVRNCKLTPADVEVPNLFSSSQSTFLYFDLSQPLLPQQKQFATSCSLLQCLVRLAFTEIYTVWVPG